MDDELDRVLGTTRTWAPGDDVAIADEAKLLAIAIAADERSTTRRWNHRVKLVAGLSAIFALGGATAVAAVPALLEWAPWEPDLVIEREFPVALSDKSQSCVVIMRVDIDDSTPDAEAARNLHDAQAFLSSNDWSLVQGDLRMLTPKERDMMRRQGLSKSAILTTSVSDQVSAAFLDAGHLKPGMSLSAVGHCGDGPTP
ncbi:hypothetical protein [Cryobacterium sp. PH31-L1]|uniref:hypothetical protein n=1 Tax=Cryobacterium sp. PH31-L1 TaxID=3046199 RepID=UPI0024BB802A|nr:hypothetical protein [Cryobacterium sp. PH31-L1]MDJ0379200.1 hypothetical protein [Cryobacterium sp. PH31-L1]